MKNWWIYWSDWFIKRLFIQLKFLFHSKSMSIAWQKILLSIFSRPCKKSSDHFRYSCGFNCSCHTEKKFSGIKSSVLLMFTCQYRWLCCILHHDQSNRESIWPLISQRYSHVLFGYRNDQVASLEYVLLPSLAVWIRYLQDILWHDYFLWKGNRY